MGIVREMDAEDVYPSLPKKFNLKFSLKKGHTLISASVVEPTTLGKYKLQSI